jgi:Heterokaryon incompatibility protein (HET)
MIPQSYRSTTVISQLAVMEKSDRPFCASLNIGGAEIRVLTIVDCTSNKVTCKLEAVSLPILPVYRALSYYWASETDTRTTVINGHEVNITSNLDAALRQFGSENHSENLD